MKKETLVFVRMATKAKDNCKGFMYIHSWATGYQLLVFESKESADKVRETFGTLEHEAWLKKPA